ncbi:hypothetical protein PEC311524_18800 [Pectobacterium carotovorum subsp. carotovorum]|nr:hypothetical protein PEC311524_18800 [Pectobacterium carotovorum subsp. carotovorum]
MRNDSLSEHIILITYDVSHYTSRVVKTFLVSAGKINALPE